MEEHGYHYWRLEVKLCLIAARLGLRKVELLECPPWLPQGTRDEVAAVLWEQAGWVELKEQQMHGRRLVEELKEELTSSYRVYRAVRAIRRLHEERAITLPEARRRLALTLEAWFSGRDGLPLDSLPSQQAIRLVLEIRAQLPELLQARGHGA